MDEQIKIQHREILERFNKIIWTHKIQLCQANIYLEEKKHQNKIMSILSTLVSASAITNFAKLVSEEYIVPVVAVLSILLTYCMYIIANKATFIVREIPNAYIKNNINSINTTSLSHSQNYEVKWQHTCLSHFL